LFEKVKEALRLISRGEMCVSVEAMFSNFDYGLVKASQEYIIKRDEESAFLTKHLVRYGGTGEYKGYSLGQVLRNISFNGKALTTKPANPASIILNETVAFNGPMISLSQLNESKESISIGTKPTVDILSISSQEKIMESQTTDKSNQVMLSQIEDLKLTVATLKKERDDAQSKALEVAAAQTKAEIDGLKADIVKRDETVASLNDQLKNLNVKLTEAADLKVKAENSLNELTKEVNSLKLGIVKSDRISALVDHGMNETDATAKVEKLISLNDEQFAEILVLVKATNDIAKNSSQVLGSATENKEVVPPVVDSSKLAEAAVVTLAQYLSKNHYTKANKFSVSK
jgi:predicted  nucleic acid-binding Zn-ribbon protein